MTESLINSSFKYCKEIAKKHYENFPVASMLLPKDKRKYVYAIYAFARAADDFADEPGIEGGQAKRLSLLEEWNQKLADCYNGKAYDPIFIALAKTVSDCKIPIEPLENLLKAFKQDVVKNRYENFDEVLAYCKNSANPVGRLVLMIFGSHDEKLFNLSDKICTALQLTNFWQDVAVDLKIDRVYLPAEDMKQYNYSFEELFKNKSNEKFKKLLKFECDRTDELFKKGKELVELTSKDKDLKKLSKELRLTWLGGTSILNKIREIDYDVFNRRPKISMFDKIKIFVKSRKA